jgi:hypothetical protein
MVYLLGKRETVTAAAHGFSPLKQKLQTCLPFWRGFRTVPNSSLKKPLFKGTSQGEKMHFGAHLCTILHDL